MGKPEAEPSDKHSITHFSHPHPLQLLNLPISGQSSQCHACKLEASGSVYTCANCNFVLHPKCYKLPQQIEHPFDKKHTFILYPKPAYPEGFFRCDACGNQGGGFSYHCSPCGVDLHTTCASLPMQLSHQCHHHQLLLNFTSPYPGNSFSCDICKRVTSKTWIYRCASCEFDVHLTCVATVIPPRLIQKLHTRAVIRVQPPNVLGSPSVVVYGAHSQQPVVMGHAHNPFVRMPQTSNGMVYANLSPATVYGPSRFGNGQLMVGAIDGIASGVPQTSAQSGLTDQLTVGAVDGIASGVAQASTQAILQGFFGVGGDGNAGGGGGVCNVDVMGMGGRGAIVDGGSYYDGTDGGYGGGDGSY